LHDELLLTEAHAFQPILGAPRLCCRRASAGLRLHDEAIVPLLAQASIDSEAIEAIIDATAAVFELFSWEVPRRRALVR